MSSEVRVLPRRSENLASTTRRAGSDLGDRLLRAINLANFISLGDWLPEMRRINDTHTVALTFDDGPSAATTQAILAALRAHSARATFFVSGVRAAARTDLVEAMLIEGHDVYGHGWEHVRLEERSVEAAVAAIDRCERLLAGMRPTPSPYLVRLPYTSGHRSAALHRALAKWRADVQFVHYSATFQDWVLTAGCDRREQAMARVTNLLAKIARVALGGRILLLHEEPFDSEQFGRPEFGAEASVALVAGLLARLQEAKLKTVSLSPENARVRSSRYLLPPRLDILRVSP